MSQEFPISDKTLPNQSKEQRDPLAMNIVNFDSMRLSLASPEDILNWSFGEVTKPETINYRTQKAEKDGLFSERIFGPTKDYECSCGKYKRIRYKGIICDRCGVEVTKSNVRRYRMGHIELAVPVAHIWYLRNTPGRIAMVLDRTVLDVEKVVYHSSYIVTEVNEDIKKDYLKQIQAEYDKKLKELHLGGAPSDEDLVQLKEFRNQNIDALQAIRKWNIISEVEYRVMSMKFGPVFKAETGSAVIRDIFASMDTQTILDELEQDLKQAEGVKAQKIMKKIRFFGGLAKAGVRPEWMFMTHIPVIPPDLRPMVAIDGGRFATSDLNDLYRKVINRNNRLKKFLNLGAAEVIIRNEKRMLQEAVDALVDNSMRRGQSTVASSTGQRRALKSLADVLKGKQGRFRQNLLGKRVDYSGRSVIVVGPNLAIDECGIPKEMALELFKPFIINKLIEEELAHNIRSATRLIEQRIDRVWDILDDITQEKFVLLNRAPTLHRLSIQAFRPKLIEGKAIQLHPMVCSPFNADFDGDQMAVHVPLSQEALKEAEQLMLSSKNLLKPSSGEPASAPGQDMVLGTYYMTMSFPPVNGKMKVFRNFDEAVQAQDQGIIDIREEVEIRNEPKVESQQIVTTVGRILFNEVLPIEFEFINETVNKKGLKKIIAKGLEIYPQEKVGVLLDAIKNFGFKHMTRSGISWAMADFDMPKGKDKIIDATDVKVAEINQQYAEGLLTKNERYSQVIDAWTKAASDIAEYVKGHIDPQGPVYTMIDSGARGSMGQLMQMTGMKGLVVSPSGNIIETPIKSSFVDGLTEIEYFISTHGARKGLVDTALKTATSGYLTRRLCDVCQDVVVTEKDCQDTEGVTYYRNDAESCGDAFENFVFGRFAIGEIIDPQSGEVIVSVGEMINREQARRIDSSTIESVTLRALVTCKTNRGVCQTCYGYDLGRNHLVKIGEAVGIVTAQAIGEPGTQLTMRTFHFGGSAGAADVTRGLPRVEEVFEARTPRTPAIMSKTTGTIVDVKEVAGELRIKIREAKSINDATKPEIVDYVGTSGIDIPAVTIGQKIQAGDALTEGHLELENLYEVAGVEALTRYVVRSVLDIYNSQGAGISTKHIEMIVRQMTSRLHVMNGGSSDYLKGQTISRDQFNLHNSTVQNEEEKIQAVPLLQGITKVALNTESFLSAASFQNTTKVLIDASLFGKEDQLRGLKENVIIGRLIPAGTGFDKHQDNPN